MGRSDQQQRGRSNSNRRGNRLGVANQSIGQRSSSSSSIRPSPRDSVSSSSSKLNVGFLSSGSSLSSLPSPDRQFPQSKRVLFDVSSDKSFFTSQNSQPENGRPPRFRVTPHPAAWKREMVCDRSLSRDPEVLYRMVNNDLSYCDPPCQDRRKSKSKSVVRHPCSCRNGRSASHFCFGSSNKGCESFCQHAIALLLEKEDRRVSIEYMRVSSSPSAALEKEKQRNDKYVSAADLSSGNEDHERLVFERSKSLHRSCGRNQMGTDLRSNSVGSKNAPFFLNGPEHQAWKSTISGVLNQLPPLRKMVEIKGMFKSQLSRFRECGEVNKPETNEAINENSELSHDAESTLEPNEDQGDSTVNESAGEKFASLAGSSFETSSVLPSASPLQIKSRTGNLPFCETSTPLNSSAKGESGYRTISCKKGSKNAETDVNMIQRSASKGPIYKHSVRIEMEMLVDGQLKAVEFNLSYKSRSKEANIKAMELRVNNGTIWHRKRSQQNRNKKEASADKK